MNSLEIARKSLAEVKVVICGAGAAAIACGEFYVKMGVRRERIRLVDTTGVVRKGRKENMNPYKGRFAADTEESSLAAAMRGADVFLGLSTKDILTPKMLESMAERPVVFACANPDPEMPYELAREVRPDAIVGTGRSDFPNQINNVLGFPFIFRGALDVRARAINDDMKLAAAHALADLARQEVPACMLEAYELPAIRFGKDYLIPKALDPRVLFWVAPAVAKAAMDSGVARIAINLEEYPARLSLRRQHCERSCRFKDPCYRG